MRSTPIIRCQVQRGHLVEFLRKVVYLEQIAPLSVENGTKIFCCTCAAHLLYGAGTRVGGLFRTECAHWWWKVEINKLFRHVRSTPGIRYRWQRRRKPEVSSV